ncbi:MULTISPECIES: homoserine dehydrogenase [Microbacterium]|jgi:homoserine dehydrogenase|uniref:homoserine dehydrogenase n=1 Tax=Microbacterium TaxID=33882 RepID=UPI0023D9BFC5|nr:MULTISPECIES: homoserine dehydrogenase [Microbacterium]MDF2045021.1 homoserine dehydrogenase [Microbacterium sp. Kw_RZR3]MDF2917107.1 homoserine dehydrogenase [Microbacterium sp.]MDQ1075556.1 homoserine dehydrogenase [Microbacterium sp. SORGH_AS_0969]MDQ1115795.1 homoserine dehydrogenase [Microbacterium testaceum]
MRSYNLALIGFGGVNRALAQLIDEDQPRFRELGFELKVVAITDLAMGSLIQADGVDLGEILALPRGTTFAGHDGGSAEADNERVIRESPADVVVEATFTNPQTGEPAASHVRWALESGKHVTTTNKGPVALHGAALNAIAAANGVRFAYEGSVMSGTPVLGLAHRQLAGLGFSRVQGVLNGTSNYVLSRMEAGLSLDAAVAEAQAHGYAEADPTADIGGSDVQLKVTILANELLGADISPADVETFGIQDITADDVAAAAREGRRWKLIGSAERDQDGAVTARVAAEAVTADHPLANVPGATNAVSFDTDLLGTVTVTGPGAGRIETAYALIADLISIDAFEKDAARV